MCLARKFHERQNGKPLVCPDGPLCGWGEIFSRRFGILGFPCPHVGFVVDDLTWDSPVERPSFDVPRPGNVSASDLEIEWKGESFSEDAPGVIPEGEELGDADGSFLEELAHECMRLAKTKVSWPTLYLAIGKSWGENMSALENGTPHMLARAIFRIDWWVAAKSGTMPLHLPERTPGVTPAQPQQEHQ
jgi:hypothetical protein